MKCLVTKLNGTIQNDNLPYFGKVKLHYQGLNDAGYLEIQCNGNTEVDVLTEGVTLNIEGAEAQGYNISPTKVMITNSTTGITSSGAKEMDILVDKYNLTKLTTPNIIGFDVTGIGILPYLTEITIINSGNLEDLKGCTSLERIICSGKNNVYGNIEELSSLTSLSYFQFYNTAITGDVTKFLDSMAVNRKSGSMVLMANSLCTNVPKGVTVGYDVSSIVTFTPSGWSVGE